MLNPPIPLGHEALADAPHAEEPAPALPADGKLALDNDETEAEGNGAAVEGEGDGAEVKDDGVYFNLFDALCGFEEGGESEDDDSADDTTLELNYSPQRAAAGHGVAAHGAVGGDAGMPDDAVATPVVTTNAPDDKSPMASSGDADGSLSEMDSDDLSSTECASDDPMWVKTGVRDHYKQLKKEAKMSRALDQPLPSSSSKGDYSRYAADILRSVPALPDSDEEKVTPAKRTGDPLSSPQSSTVKMPKINPLIGELNKLKDEGKVCHVPWLMNSTSSCAYIRNNITFDL